MKILIADDEPVSRRLLESSLRRWGYETVSAKDGLEVVQLIERSDAPKLLLLDWMMPGMDGLELCRRIRAQKEDSYTYILLLTGKRGQDDVVAGLESGADDYLTKPFDPHELKVRLRTGRRILHLMDQLVAAREALEELATHDSLTGLLNRAAIDAALLDEIMRARREQRSLAVIMLDLDRFKSINDTHGHATGDLVLRETAHTLRSLVRSYDSVGRYGGEEFLILTPGGDAITAASHAERLRKAIEGQSIPTPSGVLQVSASFGVATIDRNTVSEASAIVAAADDALYRAKRDGRNRVVVAECQPCKPVDSPAALSPLAASARQR